MPRFVRQTITGYKDVKGGYSDPECEYVIQSKQEYMKDVDCVQQAQREVTIAKNQLRDRDKEWEKKYRKLYTAYESWKNHAESLEEKESLPEGMVAISEEELNGYKKAVRIVRDRAKQQIDKSKADDHGYTLLRADRRYYERKMGKAWLVTKSTPYSVKIGLEEAYSMIERDLIDFYGYRGLPVLSESDYGKDQKTLSVKDLLDYYERFFVKEEDTSWIGNQEMIAAIRWMAQTNGMVGFEISRIAKNAASGCYEVSYWTTTLCQKSKDSSQSL